MTSPSEVHPWRQFAWVTPSRLSRIRTSVRTISDDLRAQEESALELAREGMSVYSSAHDGATRYERDNSYVMVGDGAAQRRPVRYE